MTEDMLRLVIDTAQATAEKDGGVALPNGRHLTLYCAHSGVGLTVPRVEHLRLGQGILRARNGTGETFVLALEDVFSAAIDGGTGATAAH